MPKLHEILERYFQAIRGHDWEGLDRCLAEDIVRTGPYLDVVRGRQAYVSFLSRVIPRLENYRLEISRIHETSDGGAFVELHEILDVDGRSTQFPEAIFFAFDECGLIREVSVYIKQPPPA